jgi:hypothetical protein
MRRQELSGSVQRGGRFVEDRIVGREDVGHPGDDVEGDLDVGGGSLPGERDGQFAGMESRGDPVDPRG